MRLWNDWWRPKLPASNWSTPSPGQVEVCVDLIRQHRAAGLEESGEPHSVCIRQEKLYQWVLIQFVNRETVPLGAIYKAWAVAFQIDGPTQVFCVRSRRGLMATQRFRLTDRGNRERQPKGHGFHRAPPASASRLALTQLPCPDRSRASLRPCSKLHPSRSMTFRRSSFPSSSSGICRPRSTTPIRSTSFHRPSFRPSSWGTCRRCSSCCLCRSTTSHQPSFRFSSSGTCRPPSC
jgi:hypothetical protein